MSGAITTSGLDAGTQLELDSAMAELRRGGGTIVRMADLLGRFMGRAGDGLLRRIGLSTGHPAFTPIAQMALDRAYDAALLGLDIPGAPARASFPAVALSGFLGGLGGLAGFLPDAIFTTVVIMRDIARIAREEGEDLTSEEGRAACVRVFSLGVGDEAGYISARMMLQGSPARAMLSGLATRWGSVLGEKFAAQAVPLAGAAAAVALNTAFLEHYRRIGRAHFIVRRLERTHGRERVRAAAGIAENPDEDAPFVAS
jgi:hypothetical protein